MLNASLTPLESRKYSPYGEPSQLSGSSQSVYGFTGEPTDSNGLVQLRARYLNPALGQFLIDLLLQNRATRSAFRHTSPIDSHDTRRIGMFGK